SITTAAKYGVTVDDLQFRAAVASLAVGVTRGTETKGQIFGGGSFTFNAGPGNYFSNFIAQPGGTDPQQPAYAGTDAMTVGPPPPAAVVVLTSDATAIASGQTVTLTWSSQNATTCTASGGWSGSQALSGSVKSAVLTATTTFSLTCVGTVESAAQSV